MNGFKTTLTIASVICFFLLVASCDDSGGGAATTGTANSHATGPTQGTQLLRWNEYDGGFVYQGFPHAHNVLLQAALDYGLPGLVAVVGLYAALAWAAWRLHRRLAGTPMAALAQGLGFGLLAHALHGLVDAVAIGSKIGFVPWAFAGALAGLRAEAHRLRPRGRHSDLPRG